MFSNKFPAYHPKKGKATRFIESFFWGMLLSNQYNEVDRKIKELKEHSVYNTPINDRLASFTPKKHTIREGFKRKKGEVMSPRVWSGKPYYSKQIILGADITLHHVYNFSIAKEKNIYTVQIVGEYNSMMFKVRINLDELRVRHGFSTEEKTASRDYKTGDLFFDKMTANDGLNTIDFINWFFLPRKRFKKNVPRDFSNFMGQILCWHQDDVYGLDTKIEDLSEEHIYMKYFNSTFK